MAWSSPNSALLFAATFLFSLTSCVTSHHMASEDQAAFNHAGVEVSMLGARLERERVRFRNFMTSGVLDENELWLAVELRVQESGGNKTPNRWREYTSLLTASGHRLAPKAALGARGRLHPFERSRLVVVFRLERRDLPVRVSLGDGRAKTLTL